MARLLDQLVREVPRVPWVRLMYAYPGLITDRLIATMARQPQVVPYVDLPLQHAHQPQAAPLDAKHVGQPNVCQQMPSTRIAHEDPWQGPSGTADERRYTQRRKKKNHKGHEGHEEQGAFCSPAALCVLCVLCGCPFLSVFICVHLWFPSSPSLRVHLRFLSGRSARPVAGEDLGGRAGHVDVTVVGPVNAHRTAGQMDFGGAVGAVGEGGGDSDGARAGSA